MKKTIITSTFVFFTAFCGTKAWGSGYQLRYQGAESMGTAFASQGTYGNSLSSVYYNPAIFLKQDKKNAVALEGMVLYPVKAEFEADSGETYDDFADTTFSGALYYGYRVDDTTAITVSLTTPWATDQEYPSDWVGSLAAIKTQLRTFNLQPVVSKMWGEKFAFSIGPQIQYLEGTLSQAAPNPTNPPNLTTTELDGDSLSVGAVLAFTYMPTDRTTINLAYNSQVKHQIRGELSSPVAPLEAPEAQAELYTPDVITLGASHQMSETFVGHASVSYTNWSLFDSLDVENLPNIPGIYPGGRSSTEQNWQDTYFVALGGTYMPSETMTFRGGLSYETSAVENEDRTPRTQDSDRLSLGLGASFKLAQAWNLDLGFNQIFYLGDIEQTTADNLAPLGVNYDGEFEQSASLLRVGVEYMF